MRRLPLVLAVLALLPVACAEDDPGAARPADEIGDGALDADQAAVLPDWLREVYPAPGSELSATRAIQIDFQPLAQDENVRLLIDGTDVTTFATVNQTTLVYEPDAGAQLVELSPGEHTATVELVEGVSVGEAGEVVDTFEWTFNVL